MVYRFIMLACHASETGSTPVGTAIMAPWSSGQDTTLSRWYPGFESR